MAGKTVGGVTGRKVWLSRATKNEGIKASKRVARGISDSASLGQPVVALLDSASEFGKRVGDLERKGGGCQHSTKGLDACRLICLGERPVSSGQRG